MASLFFFFCRVVRAGVHHLLVKGNGDASGVDASIEDLSELLMTSRAERNSSGKVRRVGGRGGIQKVREVVCEFAPVSGAEVARLSWDVPGNWEV